MGMRKSAYIDEETLVLLGRIQDGLASVGVKGSLSAAIRYAAVHCPVPGEERVEGTEDPVAKFL